MFLGRYIPLVCNVVQIFSSVSSALFCWKRVLRLRLFIKKKISHEFSISNKTKIWWKDRAYLFTTKEEISGWNTHIRLTLWILDPNINYPHLPYADQIDKKRMQSWCRQSLPIFHWKTHHKQSSFPSVLRNWVTYSAYLSKLIWFGSSSRWTIQNTWYIVRCTATAIGHRHKLNWRRRIFWLCANLPRFHDGVKVTLYEEHCDDSVCNE